MGITKRFASEDYVLTELGKISFQSIIDVIELPTENIREEAFYRLLTGSLVFNQFVQTMYNCYCVEALPETGAPATNVDLTEGNVYYNLADEEVYGYVDDTLSAGLSVPTGWYPAGTLLGALGYEYAGVIADILDDPRDNKFRFLLKYVVYSYKNKWVSHEVIGRVGTGVSSEIFNHPSNIASGEASHAEGSNTAALGTVSHAEGESTTASGEASHAEGSNTAASGHYQHVQGRYNINDVDANGNPLNTYAHIVGNGISDTDGSNAHTLDWDGNAWFAGDVYVGSTSGKNKDEGSVKLATIKEVDEKLAQMGSPMPTPSENDNGKFLKVVNGNPAWVSIAIAEEASF